MQFHVNGFQPGDPDVFPAAPGHRRAGETLPETVDVLIAGSGPAGLCLAAQLARVGGDHAQSLKLLAREFRFEAIEQRLHSLSDAGNDPKAP